MDESEEKFIKPCLIIPEIPADFDPTAIPQSGEEFLMHMAYERNSLPVVSFLPGHRDLELEEKCRSPPKEWSNQVSSESQYAVSAN